MSDEDKWLVVFGRGWVDRTEIEDLDDAMHSTYVRLARSHKLMSDAPMHRVKLKAEE